MLGVRLLTDAVWITAPSLALDATPSAPSAPPVVSPAAALLAARTRTSLAAGGAGRPAPRTMRWTAPLRACSKAMGVERMERATLKRPGSKPAR